MDDQGDEPALKDRLARDKHCLAAAEVDLAELQELRTKLEEEICRAERSVKDWTAKVDSSWRAVRRRIDAETDSPLEAETRRHVIRVLWPVSQV